MGYSVQNSETGELDYIYCDDSTVQQQPFDEETGEPLNGKLVLRYVKHKSFHIPKRYLRGTPCDEFVKSLTGDYHESFQPKDVQIKQHYDRDHFINMEGVKNDIILGYKKANIRMFLIPTLFFFNVYFGFVLALIETFLHWWAHKIDNLNMKKEVYYRSPLHVLSSQFCAICRAECEMDIQIFDMLNKEMRKGRVTKMFKDVTKAISYGN